MDPPADGTSFGGVNSFPEPVLEQFDAARIIEIGWARAAEETAYVPIWVVVVDGAPYVRSVRGARGRWYRELLARREGVVRVGSSSWKVRPARVSSESVIREVSAALERKYRGSRASLQSMLRSETLPTTLRLEPAD